MPCAGGGAPDGHGVGRPRGGQRDRLARREIGVPGGGDARPRNLLDRGAVAVQPESGAHRCGTDRRSGHRRGDLGPGRVDAAGSAAASAARAARLSSRQLLYRSSGSLAIALATTASNPGGSHGTLLGRPRRRVLQVRRHGGERRTLRERHAAGQQLVQHAAQGVDVDPVVQRPGLDLFGRSVGEGGQQVAGAGEVLHLVGRLGDAEVGQQHVLRLAGVVGRGQQDVGRFHVPVQQPGPVREIQAGADLADDVHDPVRGHRAVAGTGGHRGVDAGDVLHGDPQLPVDRAAVVHGDDVAVDQPGREVGLPLEPRPEVRVVGERRVQQLQRIPPRQTGMLGEVDGTHSAGAEHGFDGVTGEFLARGEDHVPYPHPRLTRQTTLAKARQECHGSWHRHAQGHPKE